MGYTRLNRGEYYEAEWTAQSASASLTQLTGALTLPAGVYVIDLMVPVVSVLSGTPTFGLRGVTNHWQQGFASQGTITWVVRLASATSVHGCTGTGASMQFSNLERGSLRAVRVG